MLQMHPASHSPLGRRIESNWPRRPEWSQGQCVTNATGWRREPQFYEWRPAEALNAPAIAVRCLRLLERLAQIDGAVETATRKGRIGSTMALVDQQRKVRAELVCPATLLGAGDQDRYCCSWRRCGHGSWAIDHAGGARWVCKRAVE